MSTTAILGTDGRLLGLWWQIPPPAAPPPPPEPPEPDFQAELDAIQRRLDRQERRLRALERALAVELSLYERAHPQAKEPHELG
jgi:hypothetical protein